MDRLARHSRVATELALLGDEQLTTLLRNAEGRASIGGTTSVVDVAGASVFVKKVPLTDLEREHVRSTANLFELPTFYQYGVGVGSGGFGAWRELAAHDMTTSWVVEGRWPGFPLLHHARVLPARTTAVDDVERAVEFWDGSQAVRERLLAIQRSTASVVLFMEHIPQTVNAWLRGGAADCDLLDDQLRAGVAVMGAGGLLHFDAHFDNLLTDGKQIYFADFGLALSSSFDLSPAETAFFEHHRSYDRCYTAAQLALWFDRYAAIGATMRDFFQQLRISRATPYPAEELERLARG
jgi:hypothetical protein